MKSALLFSLVCVAQIVVLAFEIICGAALFFAAFLFLSALRMMDALPRIAAVFVRRA